jgi:beta-lactam-binding protein with PASTA domain
MALCVYTALEEYVPRVERIRFDLLFEVGMLAEPKRKRRFVSNRLLRTTVAFVRSSAAELKEIMRRIAQKKAYDKKWLSFFFGALCGSLCIALLSAIAVLLTLFGGFFSPYDELSVPMLIGKNYQTALAEADGRFKIELVYKSSDTQNAGTVISQTPEAGAVRKLYKSGEKGARTITLTVSTGKHYYTVDELSGLSERDALLVLRNAGASVKTVYEHSASVPQGRVISSSPSASQPLYDGDALLLKISLGKKISKVSVPDLYLLTEQQAKATLEARGLVLGTITYKNSDIPAGSVILQQPSPYTKLDKGSGVDITVSLGNGFAQKQAPDLYGMTVAEAEAKLAEYGLVLGGIYTVSGGAPKGTIVAQTPIAGTPITSSIISVDIFISS